MLKQRKWPGRFPGVGSKPGGACGQHRLMLLELKDEGRQQRERQF